MPAEARREQILHAALMCFGEKGYQAATMEDLVRASGLSKGSLYLHFASKKEVFLALFDAFAADFYRDWDAAAESGEDAIEVLRRECEIIVQSFSRERMREAYTTARRKLETIIEQGRKAGSLKPGPAAGLIAGSLVGAVEGLSCNGESILIST